MDGVLGLTVQDWQGIGVGIIVFAGVFLIGISMGGRR